MRRIAGSAPGAWLGTLERAGLNHFVRRLRRGMTVWDVGANVELYTLPSARAVAPTGRVCSFEPMPRNLDLPRRHVVMNGLSNVEIYEAAVGDLGDLGDGRRRFAQ
jgi:tRNA A58 N-methylase Trm61